MNNKKHEEKMKKEEVKNEDEKLQEVIEEEVKEDDNEQKIKELEEKVLRMQAEMQNYKRRRDEEANSIVKFANESLIESILPTIDNFERAIAIDDNNLNDELSKFLEGFKMIYASFINVLNEIGLNEIEALDKPFDPTYHQAVMTDKDESKEDGIVLEVLQKGYMLKDKLVRASLVKVNNL
jgi:molecular chaperone GrpE